MRHNARPLYAGTGRGPCRLAVIAGCSGLFTIALVLYFVSVLSSSTLDFPSISAHISPPVPPPNVAEQEESFVLHPKAHIYRKPKTLELTWNVTRAVRAPDGVEKLVYLVNGEFPGPTIEARPGDSLEINVYNHVFNDTEGIAVHWHGLLMSGGANLMDGAVGVTQCAIPFAQNYTYRFTLDANQRGTFWYHAHSHEQRADGLFGGLVIHKPVEQRGAVSDLSTYRYDQEKLLMIGDWYHWPGNTVLDWYRNPDHYGYEPAPDSLLINGKGAYNCSNAVKARPINCTAIDTPSLLLPRASRLRLRVVNTGASAGYSIVVKGGTMQLISVDGAGPVADDTPMSRAIGLLYPGERIDMILDQSSSLNDGDEAGNEMTIELDRENMPLKNFALTRIQTFPFSEADRRKQTVAQSQGRGEDFAPLYLRDVKGPVVEQSAAVLSQPYEKAVLYTTVQIRSSNHNQPVGIFNHTSWILTDSQAKPLLALDEDDWQQVTTQPSVVQKLTVPAYPVDETQEKWMELVVNNMDDKGHPFHMHGHTFHVALSQQANQGEYGAYNPFDPEPKHPAYPTSPFAPLLKDTVYIPAQGYVILRFPLNNSGLWLMHCHVLWHQAVGMGMVFKIGEIDPDAKERAASFCTR